MDVLGIGFPELVLIAVIALAVAGPKRLARWAYRAGRWFRDIRDMWNESIGYINEEIKAAGKPARTGTHLGSRKNLTSGANPEPAPRKSDREKQTTGQLDEAESATKSPYDAWLPR